MHIIIHITRIIDIIHIIHIIHIMTIYWIVVCFHRRHKWAVEGLGPSVCLSRGWEQEQYLGMTDCFLRHNKSSIVDSWRQNHDRVQSVTAVVCFCRKQAAVYLLHSAHQGTWCVLAPNTNAVAKYNITACQSLTFHFKLLCLVRHWAVRVMCCDHADELPLPPSQASH